MNTLPSLICRLLRSGGLLRTTLVAGLCAILAGCGNTGAPTTPTTDKPAPSPAAVADTEEQCANLLKSISDIFELDSLGFSTQISDGVALLNQWLRTCGPEGDDSSGSWDLPAEIDEQLAEHLSPRQLQTLLLQAFSDRDGEHIRNCLLMKAIVQAATEKADGDMARVQRLFDYVVLNMSEETQHPTGIPLPLYESCIRGQGLAADRVWWFVELLRQLRIEAVVLADGQRTFDPEDWDPQQPFLVGVLLQDQVYLFDPRLGVPLKNDAGDTATLAQILAKPELLKQFNDDRDDVYAVKIEMLQNPRVFVVGSLSLWAPRMGLIKGIFTGARAVALSDRLIGDAEQPGILNRLAKVPGQPWKPEQLAIWPYPLLQMSAFQNLAATHKQTLSLLRDTWNGPFQIKEYGLDNARKKSATPTYRFIKTRLAHLQGRLEDAVKGYTGLQLEARNLRGPIPSEVMQNPLAGKLVLGPRAGGEQATYWLGVTKMLQGGSEQLGVAEDKLRIYLRNYPQGDFADAAHFHYAKLAAGRNDWETALDQLVEISPDHPAHLIHARWKRIWQMKQAEAQAQQ